MFYDKDSIDKQFSLIENKLEDLFIFEPMPSYKEGERWTDEFRIRDGHTKLDNGSWVTIHKATEYFQALKKNTVELFEDKQKIHRELVVSRQKNREMEYGLRVAEKALKNSLAITKELIDE
jgi:hypothetical protein